MKQILGTVLLFLVACAPQQRSMHLSFETALLRLADSAKETGGMQVLVRDVRPSSEVGQLITETGGVECELVTPDDFIEKLQNYASKKLAVGDALVTISISTLSCGFTYDFFRPVSYGTMTVDVQVVKDDDVEFSDTFTVNAKDTYYVSHEKVAATILEDMFVEAVEHLLANRSFVQALDA